jgi:hypothetical protein
MEFIDAFWLLAFIIDVFRQSIASGDVDDKFLLVGVILFTLKLQML